MDAQAEAAAHVDHGGGNDRERGCVDRAIDALEMER
jgi:hypothetical protein